MEKRLLEECYEDAMSERNYDDAVEVNELLQDQLKWEAKAKAKGYNEGIFVGVATSLIAVAVTLKFVK